MPFMAATLIVSYDGTTNDDDALALGQMLCPDSGTLALAYVRHSREYDPRREEIAEHDAQRRLDHGTAWLDASEVTRHVVVDPSTGAGLSKLAVAEGASVVVFGSDYRTPPGRVEPGASAQSMLSGGPVAVAIGQAGLRLGGHGQIATISVSPSEDDTAAQETAASLAEALGASVSQGEDPSADLIVVGSSPTAPAGKVGLSGATRAKLDSARSSVLVVARETPILF
jgi:nucleotide-binding universal stress UspA family protein